MATTEILIQKTVDLGKFSIVEVRINLVTNIAEFLYDLTNKDGAVTKNVFTQDLSQWEKFAGMVADLCAKAGADIEKEAKKKLKDKETNHV
jgi:hypothetical protein